jgi:hypothetical protein
VSSAYCPTRKAFRTRSSNFTPGRRPFRYTALSFPGDRFAPFSFGPSSAPRGQCLWSTPLVQEPNSGCCFHTFPSWPRESRIRQKSQHLRYPHFLRVLFVVKQDVFPHPKLASVVYPVRVTNVFFPTGLSSNSQWTKDTLTVHLYTKHRELQAE